MPRTIRFCGLSVLVVLFAIQPSLAAVDVQGLIDAAIARGEARVVLPAGVIRVEPAADKGPYHLRLRGVKNFELVGDETTLSFTQPRVGGLHLSDCEHVTLRGITLDWDPLPFTQGKITGLDLETGTISIAVDPGFSDDPDLFAKGSGGIVYDPKTRLIKRQSWEVFGTTMTRTGPATIALKCKTGQQLKGSGAAVGDLIAVRAFSGEMAIRLVDCADITLADVTIFSAPGMAIQELGGVGRNKYTVTVTRGPHRNGVERLLSSTADALHSSGVQFGPTAIRCTLEYQGDDGIAIHGAYAIVAGNNKPDALVVSPKHELAFRPGDRLRVYDGTSFTLKGEATVSAITKMSAPSEDMRARMSPIWKAYRGDAAKAKYAELKIDRPLAVEPGDLVSSPDRLGSGFSIQNCRISHVRARGINVKASNGVIENNLIEDTTSAGIAMGPEFAYWLEGDYVRDIVVRGNDIRNAGIGGSVVRHDKSILVGAISIYALTPDKRLPAGTDNANILIEHNTIDSCGGIGMLIACAKNVQVRSNTVSNLKVFGQLEGGQAYDIDPDAAIYVDQSEDVRFDGNTLSGKAVVLSKSTK